MSINDIKISTSTLAELRGALVRVLSRENLSLNDKLSLRKSQSSSAVPRSRYSWNISTEHYAYDVGKNIYSHICFVRVKNAFSNEKISRPDRQRVEFSRCCQVDTMFWISQIDSCHNTNLSEKPTEYTRVNLVILSKSLMLLLIFEEKNRIQWQNIKDDYSCAELFIKICLFLFDLQLEIKIQASCSSLKRKRVGRDRHQKVSKYNFHSPTSSCIQ